MRKGTLCPFCVPIHKKKKRKIEITVDKVKMKLKKLNSNKSAGPDGFYPRVIKETEEETAPHFCNIFRTSLEQRKAVRDWKPDPEASCDRPGVVVSLSLSLTVAMTPCYCGTLGGL